MNELELLNNKDKVLLIRDNRGKLHLGLEDNVNCLTRISPHIFKKALNIQRVQIKLHMIHAFSNTSKQRIS